jgi:hypothetical protein
MTPTVMIWGTNKYVITDLLYQILGERTNAQRSRCFPTWLMSSLIQRDAESELSIIPGRDGENG